MPKLSEDEKKEIIEEIDDFYTTAKKERELYEKDWYFNLAFHLGHQWITWNEWTRRIEEPKAPSWRVRITANHIAPICNQIIAKLTKNRPIWQVIPATSEDEDVNTARMGEKTLQYLARILKTQTKNQEMWLWAVITGSAFKLPYWDADAKEVIDEENNTHLGEVGIDVLSCFEVLPELGATSEYLTRVMITRTRSLDYIREKYPDTGEEVQDEGISGKTPVEERLFDLMKKSAPTYEPIKKEKEEKGGNAIVKEYRQLPSKKNPKGRYIIVANGVFLNPDSMDLPFEFLIKERKLGLLKYDYEKVPGRFWGKGRPEDLIPLQKEYNRCVDIFTEILTPNGWKKYNEILIGDSVLTYNKEKDICEWQSLEDIFIKNYQGFLNVLESNQISSRTTSGHTFIVKHRINKKLFITKNPNGEHSIPLIRPIKNDNLDNVLYSDEFIKLVGYAVTEGQYVKPREKIDKRNGKERYSNKIAISQSIKKNPNVVKEIEESLIKSNNEYGKSINKKSQVISFNLNSELGKEIREVAPDKIPSYHFINLLSLRQLKILLNAIIAGDGMVRVTYSGKLRLNFYSSDLGLAERVQYIGILLGENPKLKVYEAKSEWHKKPFQYVVTFKIERFKEYASVHRAKKEPVYYSGIIWCPTVKNGFWLSRRDGKINITGNTRSQIIEIKNLMSKPKWAVPIGSGIKKTHLTSEPGEIVYYNPGVPAPQQLLPASLPAYILREPEITKRDMQDVSGIHEVCVDTKTECLTKNGFKKYNEVKVGDEILTFNIKFQKTEWKKIDRVHLYNHNGLLHRLENMNISSLCTPNHKWLIKRNSGKYDLIKTSKLNTDCSILLRSKVSLPQIKKYSDEYVKLIGWIVTEGTYSLSKQSIKRGRQTIRISQSIKSNPDNCKEIEDIIIKLYGKCGKGIQKDGIIQFYFAKDLARGIRKEFPDKILTYDFINSLTKNQLRLLLITMIKADGHDPKNNGGSGKKFYSSNIRLAEQFQYVCVLNGYASNLNIFRKAEGKHKTIYFVSVKLSELVSYVYIKNDMVEYKGIVWCPETINETFLARRNGLVYFTGNSKAQVPTGVRSGLAIQYLQEQDDTRLGPIIMRFEEAEGECGHELLHIVKENYKEPRLIRIIGRDNRIEAFDFKGADLGDNLDVIVQAGSAFPLNKVAKQQFVLNLWLNKIITEPRQILKMLEFGTFEEIYEDFAMDEKNAQEENRNMQQGNPEEVEWFDNDDIHIYEHIRFIKANKLSPIIMEFISQHVDGHTKKKMMALQAVPNMMPTKQPLSPKQTTQLTPKKPSLQTAGMTGGGM